MAKAKENIETAAQEAFDSFAAFFMVPGVDMTSMTDVGRKNMETGTEISKIIADCSREIMSRQVDLVKENTKDFVTAITNVSTNKVAEPDMSAGFEFYQGIAKRSAASAKEIGDVIVASNQEIVSKMQQRYKDTVSELKTSAS